MALSKSIQKTIELEALQTVIEMTGVWSEKRKDGPAANFADYQHDVRRMLNA